MFDFATIRRYVLIGLAALIVLVAILLSFFTVKQYERAVVTTWGKFTYVAEPGLGFKIPFVQSAHAIRTDIRTLTPPDPRAGRGQVDTVER